MQWIDYFTIKNHFSEVTKKGKISRNMEKSNKPINKHKPIFGKISGRLVYSSLFNYFLRNKIFTHSQSGFLPGDSCIAQLLSILHEIQPAFDENATKDIKSVFWDISKGFDSALHSAFIFKLKACGIEGELLFLLENYLQNGELWVVLYGQTSEWRKKLWCFTRISIKTTTVLHNYLPDELTSMWKSLLMILSFNQRFLT